MHRIGENKMNRNLTDINCRLDHAGAFAAMFLAAERGDMASYKQALTQTYGTRHVAKRVYEQTVDQAYIFAMQKIGEYVDGLDGDATLEFWLIVAENYEKRHCAELIGELDETK